MNLNFNFKNKNNINYKWGNFCNMKTIEKREYFNKNYFLNLLFEICKDNNISDKQFYILQLFCQQFQPKI